MNYEQLDTFLITLYVIVDDLYQAHCVPLLPARPGPQHELADSEVLTLTLAQQLLCFETEPAFVSFAHANLGHLFPKLLDQSQFNRRVRALGWALGWALEQIRQQALWQLCAWCATAYLSQMHQIAVRKLGIPITLRTMPRPLIAH